MLLGPTERIRAQLVVPGSVERFDAIEIDVVVGARVATGVVAELVEEVGSPHDSVELQPLRCRVGSAALPRHKPSHLEACAVFFVVGSDLEPMPDRDGDLVEDKDLLHLATPF